MDSITQVVLGVATSEVGFRRKLGKRANWLAAASALLPDLDFIIQRFAGEWGFMTVHRGLSHSFLFSLLAPFPLAWLFWRKSKPDRNYWSFWACSFVAIFSHLLLDLCTSYGTKVLLPFSNHRFAWNFISVIDLVYSSILILTLIGCGAARKRGGVRWGPWIALAGFVLSTGYIGVGAGNHARAVKITERTAEGIGENPVRVEAYPRIGTVFVWRAVAETKDAFLVGRISFLRDSDLHLRRLPKELNRWAIQASKHPKVQEYKVFAMGMLRPILVEGEDGWIIEFDDMRYALPTDNTRSIWSAQVRFSEDGRIIRVSPIRRRHKEHSISWMIRASWNEMWR